MRTFSPLFSAADLGTGTGETPAFNAAPTGNSNVAAPAAKPVKRVIKAKPGKPAATKPAAKAAAKPAAKPAKPDAAQHGFTTAYRGPSPVIRAHGRKLSPIVLDRIPGNFTDRDGALLRAMHAKFGEKPFQRLDLDAGAVSRQIGFGYFRHVSGNLDERTATFAVTAKARTERLRAVSAKPAKA